MSSPTKKQAGRPTASRWQTYEFPLNERVRTFMRLEHLFARVQRHAQGTDPWDSHAALTGLLEILAILGRGDVRSDVLREMERQGQTLGRLKNRDGVDSTRLGAILENLEKLRVRLDASEAQVGRNLKANELISALKQRSAIPGGTCGFDLPALQHWLSLPAETRREQLDHWLNELGALNRSVRLVLMLLRESAAPSTETAENGMFHRNLESGAAYQLIRVQIEEGVHAFPEISGGKHRFTVRFLEQPDIAQRPRAVQRDIAFQLVCCQL
ncbi:MAG TPA: cell division protein ZapD [Gammaproteobacteria bacterium]